MTTPSLENISEKSKIKLEDIAVIIKIIRTQTPTVSELVKETSLSRGQIKRFLSSVKPFVNYAAASSRLTLTDKGLQALFLQQEDTPPSFKKEDLEEFIHFSKALSPKPNREYDQFCATIQTVLKRVEKFIKEKDLQKRKVAFLGDGDLTSLAAAYIFCAEEITVLEIDENILNVIEETSRKFNLNIQSVKWDLRKAIPRGFLHRFDTVFTDPPYTANGFDLFLRRSLEATKENSLSSHYICYGTSSLSRERSLKIQRIINNYALFVREKLPNFNTYIQGAEAVGNVSDLYILEKTPQTKLGKSKPAKKLYTWE